VNSTKGRRAYSFGISREAYNKVFDERNTSPDSCVPGPGSYQVPETIAKGGKVYSMKPRTKDPNDPIKLNKFVPGPGQYED